MNIKLLFILALGFIATGCAQAPIAADGGPLAGCQKQSKRSCKGNPQAPTVNVNTKAAKLRASPYCVKVEEGTQLIIRLTPPGNEPLNAVEIIPKKASHTWLKAKNDTFQDMIIIDVPEELADEDYYYGIKTSTKCLDPRIHVVN